VDSGMNGKPFDIPIYIPDSNSPDVKYTISVASSPTTYFNTTTTYFIISPIVSTLVPYNLYNTYNYNDSVGTLAIVSADLKIGGQTIETLTGEYIELWNELNVPYENQPGLQLMTGKYDTLTSIPPPGRTYYVNLPFYFYENPGLYLPMCALERQDVEVWIQFNKFSNLTSINISSQQLSATIITEYVYLSKPEINWFKTNRIDYVITQCQYENFPVLTSSSTSIFKLNFKNPVKELFFVIQPLGQTGYNYSNNGLQSLGLSFNGEDVFLNNTIDSMYLNSIEPLNHHMNFFSLPPQPQQQVYGRQFFMYSFTSDPASFAPSGHINFSRIHQALLELNIDQNYLTTNKELRVLASSLNVLRIQDGIAGIMFN
jgi:hypothetical protein